MPSRAAKYASVTAVVVVLGLTGAVFGQALDVDALAYGGLAVAILGILYLILLTLSRKLFLASNQPPPADGSIASPEKPSEDK